MDKAVDIAGYIAKKYRKMSGGNIDEMKLHTLLYFTQRESIAITGDIAFEENMEGWKFGPVCPEVRYVFLRR